MINLGEYAMYFNIDKINEVFKKEPNDMQRRVLDSKKRVVVIGSQPGAGSTVALFLKLAEELYQSKNNFGVYLKFENSNLPNEFINGGKKSKTSDIIKFKYKGKKIKIKIADVEWFDQLDYIPITAVSKQVFRNSNPEKLINVMNCSGKVLIETSCSQLKETNLHIKLGLYDEGKWSNHVDFFIGLTSGNNYLTQSYIKCLESLNESDYNRLMDVDFN